MLVPALTIDDFHARFDGDDGTLPDCEVEGGSLDDWTAVFTAIQERGWQPIWKTDEGDADLPSDIGVLLQSPTTVAATPGPNIQLLPEQRVSAI